MKVIVIYKINGNEAMNFSAEEIAILRNCELLRGLSDKNFNTFMTLSHRTTYKAGEALLKEGQNSDYLFIIISGTANLYKTAEGASCLIGSLSSGQTIGEMRVIKNRPCSLTVVSSAPTVVLCILLSRLRNLEYNQCYESILDAIINILSSRLENTNQLAAGGKAKSKKRFIFPFIVAATVILFVCELTVALYYFR